MQRQRKSARTVLTLNNSVPGSLTARASKTLHGASDIYTPAADEPQAEERSATGPSKLAADAEPSSKTPKKHTPIKPAPEPVAAQATGTDLAACKAELAENIKQRQSLESDLSSAKSQAAAAQALLQSELATCTAQRQQKEAELATARKQAEKSQGRMRAATDGLGKCQRNMINLQSKLDATESMLKAKEQQSGKLTADLMQAIGEFQNLPSQETMTYMHNTIIEKVKRITAELQKCRDEKKLLLAEQQRNSASKRDAERKLEDKEHEANALREQLRAQEREVVKRDGELGSIMEQVARLEGTIAEKTRMLTESAEKTQDATQRLQAAQRAMQDATRKLQAAESAKAQLTADLAQSEAHEELIRQQLQAATLDLEAARQEILRKEGNTQTLLIQLRQAETEKEAAKTELHVKKEAHAKLTAKKEAEVRSRLHESFTRESEIREQLERAQREITESTERTQHAERLQEKLDESKTETQDMKQKLQDAESEMAQLTLNLEQSQSHEQHIMLALQSTRTELEEARREIRQKEGDTQRLNEQLSEAQKEQAEVKTELRTNDDKQARLHTRITELSDQLRVAQEELTATGDAMRQCESNNEQLSDELLVLRQQADSHEISSRESTRRVEAAVDEANTQANRADEAEAAHTACKTAAHALQREMIRVKELADEQSLRASRAEAKISEVESESSRKTEQLESDARRGEELLQEIKRNGAAWYWQNEEEAFETLLGTDFGLTRPIENLEQMAEVINDKTDKLIPSVLRTLRAKCSLVTKKECFDCNEMSTMPKADLMRRIAWHARRLHAASGATNRSASVFLRESRSELERRLKGSAPISVNDDTYDSEEEFHDAEDGESRRVEEEFHDAEDGANRRVEWRQGEPHPVLVLAAAYSLARKKLRLLRTYLQHRPELTTWTRLTTRAEDMFHKWTEHNLYDDNEIDARKIFRATLRHPDKDDGYSEARKEMSNWIAKSHNKGKDENKLVRDVVFDIMHAAMTEINEETVTLERERRAYEPNSRPFRTNPLPSISALYSEIVIIEAHVASPILLARVQYDSKNRLLLYQRQLGIAIKRENDFYENIQKEKEYIQTIEQVARISNLRMLDPHVKLEEKGFSKLYIVAGEVETVCNLKRREYPEDSPAWGKWKSLSLIAGAIYTRESEKMILIDEADRFLEGELEESVWKLEIMVNEALHEIGAPTIETTELKDAERDALMLKLDALRLDVRKELEHPFDRSQNQRRNFYMEQIHKQPTNNNKQQPTNRRK